MCGATEGETSFDRRLFEEHEALVVATPRHVVVDVPKAQTAEPIADAAAHARAPRLGYKEGKEVAAGGHPRVFCNIVVITELVKAGEACPVGLQGFRDVHTNEALKEEDLFLEGGAGLLQRVVGDEAVWGRPHEDATTGGDVGPVEADSKAILGLGFASRFLRETCIYGDADV
jgi:hypothetical protein